MDINYDESWCPVCDRQIMPKRYTVPIAQPQPQPSAAPQVPPTSPSTSPSKNQQSDNSSRTTRTKTGTIRARGGGLVQGTGRVKPNGALKRSDSGNAGKTRVSPPPQQSKLDKPAAPTKVRTVIDQGPIPLYCSDDCRLEDLSRYNGAFPIDYNPNRASPPLPPAPHNSFEGPVFCDSEDESSSSSSVDSRFSSESESIMASPSIATLAAMYDFPPLPPAPPILFTADSSSTSEPEYRNDYQSGVMMAAKRIQAALCPAPAKPSSSRHELPQPRKSIPGWTDGSDAWRESVYSFSPRSNSVATIGTESKPSFAASSHRGVQWSSSNLATSSSSSSLPAHFAPSRPPPCSSQSYTDELYAKYSLPLSRRSESRSTLFPPSTSYSSQSLPPLSPSSTSSSRRRRETPLMKAGAEGRLLVPNVALRAQSPSSQSLSSGSLCSPLSRYPSEISEDSMWSEQRSESALRPQTQVRSWSYDNIKTYPVMMPPPKKEKRVETRMVDGKAKQVEVEVEIVQPVKRLFLFHGKETSPERRW
ncbi:hypothetical protein HYDPIDRAFT_175559 [Hydnomerulius pinastri MD-312]|uniref:Uncharacterized protein n=1 Tax=Hydnomerulius pinastri MD-312 TaxID=994086 RepID=A0A0C9VGD4_9AGAM|nr:hypothetical protein HYDPIDRAFT_175559 [Hydnomerulius pinastri MD-312]